jgi:hypothetical protein
MVTSFSQEHEDMTEILTESIAECIELKNKNVDLNKKFEAYFEKSTDHMKKQEKAIEELSKEVQSMKYQHANNEALIKVEVEKAEKYLKWYKDLEEPFLIQKNDLHKIKLEVIKYE